MLKRPTANETEDDILRMQKEFLIERQRNPKMQPSARIVKPAKKSIFAQRLTSGGIKVELGESTSTTLAAAIGAGETAAEKNIVFGEIVEKPIVLGKDDGPTVIQPTVPPAYDMVKISNAKMTDGVSEIFNRFRKSEGASSNPAMIVGDIIERSFHASNVYRAPEMYHSMPFCEASKASELGFPTPRPSIFARSVALANAKSAVARDRERKRSQSPGDSIDSMPVVKCNVYGNNGNSSAIINDPILSKELHNENMVVLGLMSEVEIMAERNQLMETVDPTYITMLMRKRQDTAQNSAHLHPDVAVGTTAGTDIMAVPDTTVVLDKVPVPDPVVLSGPTTEILARSQAERWINFDVVELDKLAWMNDLSAQTITLEPNKPLEARFDWKGVLLADTIHIKDKRATALTKHKCDDRELYLHGEEPNRAGYTLQEFFRFARSNVQQQRTAAFGAIAGMIKIYNNGFYDGVLDLPLSKIFFLLRFGFDDNNLPVLENVARAFAYMFYNEADEAMLDASYENPVGIWQPLLRASEMDNGNDDSIDSITRKKLKLRMNIPPRTSKTASPISADVNDEQYNVNTLTDLELAESDLIACLWRTNIDQRIFYILHVLRPANSAPESCLKLLIRIARSSPVLAETIVVKTELISCIFEHFLPGLERVDITQTALTFYNYPQHIALKLMRVLISQSVAIAREVIKHPLFHLLQSYLINSHRMHGNLLKVQIESLRILRCLLVLDVNAKEVQRIFLPSLHYMLMWHLHNSIYDASKSPLIRQHSSAVMEVIANGRTGYNKHDMLFEAVSDCCNQWFFHSARHGIKDFSQATLLTAALDAFLWTTKNDGDFIRYKSFCDNQIRDFISSAAFVDFISAMAMSSVFASDTVDRRSEHPPLPNVGSVVVRKRMPQLVVGNMYPAHLFNVIYRLMIMQMERSDNILFKAFTEKAIAEPLKRYIKIFAANPNSILATNFYARAEISMLFKLVTYEGFSALLPKGSKLGLLFQLTNCLTSDNAPDIEKLMDMLVFNPHILKVDQKKLDMWKQSCLEIVQSHFIVLSPHELTLTIGCDKTTVLQSDWPFMHIKWLLKDYIEMLYQQPANSLSECDILDFTFTTVGHLHTIIPEIVLCSPTEELMYLMIAFMGSETQFLDPEINILLRGYMQSFLKRHANHTFDFDKDYEDKCKFENLYVLFVNQFQAAGYGSDLFSALMLLPLAQKYDNKLRRRVWSDCSSALRFLDCDESLLIGGVQAYLDPVESDPMLVLDYANAIRSKAVREGSVPYIIAKHHVDSYIPKPLKPTSKN